LQSTLAVFYGNIFIVHLSGGKISENKNAGKKCEAGAIKRKSERGVEFSLTPREYMFTIVFAKIERFLILQRCKEEGIAL